MTERRNIGDILKATGRVTNEDVLRAVDYQRANGGYLGEALVALGCLTQDELRWSLASQFDLPYVFPDPESIDPEAAALVTPEWALAHLALPIMKTGETLTVVVDSPLKSRAIEELQARTDLDVQLALASSWKIRELVRQVYARMAPREAPARASVLKVDVAVGSAIEAASRRFGISTRGNRVWFWYDEEGTVHRSPLDAAWREGLARIASPKPSELLGGQRHATVETEVLWGGFQHPVELKYLSTAAGEEWVFTPIRAQLPIEERFPAPPGSVVSEVRLLARSGSARFLVLGEPHELAGEILPHLPRLLLDPAWRSVHVVANPQRGVDEVFTVAAPRDAEQWARDAEGLRTFQFDAVSVDGTDAEGAWSLGVLDVAPVAFVLADEHTDRRASHEAGVRWELRIAQAPGESLTWNLDPVQA